MNRIRPLRPPEGDNDDVDSWDGRREEPISVIVAEQSSDTSFTAGARDVWAAFIGFVEDKCPFLLHFSSYTLGVLLIFCVTVIWVASSNWIQYIFGNLNYNKPYFLTYFNTTGFSFWNLGYYFVPKWGKIPWDDRDRPQPILVEDPNIVVDSDNDAFEEPRGHRHPRRHHRDENSSHNTPSQTHLDGRGGGGMDYLTDIRVWAINNGYDPSIFSSDSSSASEISMEEIIDVGDVPDLESGTRGVATPRLARVARVRPYSRRNIWFWAAVFCPFWFFANYLFNVSLSITSVASNTVLSATSSIWTLLLSYLLLNESVGPLKWLAVGLCVAGSIMVGLSDNDGEGGRNTVLGDIVALISAFFYATYTSILRYGLPDDERYAMGMVFGAVGAINFVCLWPGLILVDLLSWEKFVWPTVSQFWPLLLNALIGTNLSDVLWARSVVLTSPVVATLGLALTTPLAMIVDALFKGTHFSVQYVVGAVLVMCGFVLVNLPFMERWPRWLTFW